MDERSGVVFAWGVSEEDRFWVVRALNQGKEHLPPGAPVGECRIADDVTRLCKGAPNMDENPPVTDPSANTALVVRSSVHDDGLFTFLRLLFLKPSLLEIK